MAYNEFASVKDVKSLNRAFGRWPDEVRDEVKAVNKDFADRLAVTLRPEMPRSGGVVQHRSKDSREKGPSRKSGQRKKTMAQAIRSYAGVNYSAVRAPSKMAPHFAVNEFGGAVWWNTGGAGWAKAAFGSKRLKGMSMKQLYFETRGMNRKTGEMFAKSRLGGHIIPVRERAPMTISHDGRKFPGGWFFFPNALRHIPQLVIEHGKAMHEVANRVFRTF